jgi:hypothetical protein
MPPCVDENQIEPDLDSSRDSSSFERLLELALIADLTQEAWFGRHQIVDVLHSTVDAFGHDVVFECGQVLRHVQIKGRAMNGTTTRYKINTRLAARPSGCVIWLGWQRRTDVNRLDMEYRWLGGLPGERLPDLGNTVAKHTKANAQGIKIERPDIRIVPPSRFEKLASMSELLDRLFGSPNPPLIPSDA